MPSISKECSIILIFSPMQLSIVGLEAFFSLTLPLFMFQRHNTKDQTHSHADPELKETQILVTKKKRTTKTGSRSHTTSRLSSIGPTPGFTIQEMGGPHVQYIPFDSPLKSSTKSTNFSLPSPSLCSPQSRRRNDLFVRPRPTMCRMTSYGRLTQTILLAKSFLMQTTDNTFYNKHTTN